MTREEAIIILKNTASLLRDGTRYMKPEHEKQFREAYEMAIEALEQPDWEELKLRTKLNDDELFVFLYLIFKHIQSWKENGEE